MMPCLYTVCVPNILFFMCKLQETLTIKCDKCAGDGITKYHSTYKYLATFQMKALWVCIVNL